MSREVKLGLLTFITLFAAVWGYRFIKGQNLFQPSRTYMCSFPDVTGLAVSSDVMVNGYKIGTVTDININPNDVHAMDVTFRVDGKINIPKSAVAVMKNESLVGGKALSLEFDKVCDGVDCAPSGYKFEGKSLGLLGSMLSPDELSQYVGTASNQVKDLLNELGKEGQNGKVDLIVRNLEATMGNIAAITANLNQLLAQSQQNMTGMLANMNKITKNLADNNAQITGIMNNLNTTTKQLAAADIGVTLTKTNSMLDNSSEAVKKLETTLETTSSAVKDLNAVLAKINRGEGSIGQLLNDKKLYENLEATSRNMSLLLQDLRLNPKRYVNVSLIGGKEKPYTKPENDPANQ